MASLPRWTSLLKNFPNKSAPEVFSEIGGKVQLNYEIGVFSNACAIRISKALNFSGDDHRIPFFKTPDSNGNDVVQVSSGGTGNWYIYRVKILAKYLAEKYGPGRMINPSHYKIELSGKKGIIVFEVSGWSDATGHADLWDGAGCVGSDYGERASKILFWETF